jgi:hypothetical protein
MTHCDAGRYAAKHGSGEVPDERVAGVLREKTVEGELACADAERIGLALQVTLAEVGRNLDLLELRISRCQLGLFGYPEGRTVRTAAALDSDLDEAIRGRLADGRLPCRAAWEIAAERKVARMVVSNACERLKIKIKPCQLGAF